jgi:hypothetical protein
VPGAERLLGVGQISAVVSPDQCGELYLAADDMAAMQPQQALDETIATPPVALHEEGVAAYGLTTFTVTLLPVIDETMTVTDVSIRVFDHRPAQVAWAIGWPIECGGNLFERRYSASLDNTPITVVSDDTNENGGSVGFTVSPDEPAELDVSIRACDGMYEFGLEFRYRVRGTESVVRVGTEHKPLRLLGGEPARALEIRGSRTEVFEVSTDVASTLCQDGVWNGHLAEDAGGDIDASLGEDGPIDPELADEDVAADWERACADLESTLSPLEQTVLGCVEGEDAANAHDAACAKAETVLNATELSMLACGENIEEGADAYEAACAKAETVLNPIEVDMLGCGEDEMAEAYDAACAKAETVLSREQLALFCYEG